MAPTSLSAAGLAKAIAARELSPVEVLEAHAARIAERNGELNAIVVDDLDRARERAIECERALMRGDEVGPLHGVPFTVKEAIEVEGLPSCTCSRLVPAEIAREDAPVVAAMRDAGAVLVGKTNMSEFAFFPDSVNRVYGATRNPVRADVSAGGSSGGEACAVASGMSAIGIGSDYGGSIRAPAHFCGVAGLRTGRGLIPLRGHLPRDLPPGRLRWSTIGPIARSVADLELVVRALAPGAATDDEVERVAVVEDAAGPAPGTPCATAVERAVALLQAGGMGIERVGSPLGSALERCFDEITRIETKLWLSRLLPEGLEEATPQTVIQWESVADVEPDDAEHRRLLADAERLEREGDAWMAEHPVLLTPAGNEAAFALGRVDLGIFDLFPQYKSASALGLPAVVVPVAFTPDGLPVGVQLIGRRGHELTLVRVARRLEEAVAHDAPAGSPAHGATR